MCSSDLVTSQVRMVAHQVENQVVALAAFGEILSSIIEDALGAEGAHHLHVPGAAHAGHMSAERLGDLHREGANASRGAIDQDALAGLKLSRVAKTLQGREPRQGNGSRLLETQVCRA